MELCITQLTHEAEGIRGIELRALGGGALPPFSAGAHVDVHLPGGLCRQYSLTNDPQDTHRYCLGVGLAPSSRGGSLFLHQRLAVGQVLTVGMPRALFGIDERAAEHVFIAGGIGITPILSMVRWCVAQGRPWRLLYCVRSRSRAAFLWTLASHEQRVCLHVDEEAGGVPDLRDYIARAPAGAHVYCCGPSPLMDAVATAAQAMGLPRAATHFERFSADTPAPASDARPFTVLLQRRGRRLTVAPGQSILQALESHGIAMPFSCREGLCRSCEVPLLGGTAEHRDHVLSDDERIGQRSILLCVSRAVSDELVIDA